MYPPAARAIGPNPFLDHRVGRTIALINTEPGSADGCGVSCEEGNVLLRPQLAQVFIGSRRVADASRDRHEISPPVASQVSALHKRAWGSGASAEAAEERQARARRGARVGGWMAWHVLMARSGFFFTRE